MKTRKNPTLTCRGIFAAAILLCCCGLAFSQPNLLGTETIANTVTANSQQNPAIAVDSTGMFTIVWESYGTDGSDYGIYAAVFNADGSTATAEFRVNSTTSNGQRFPSVACDGAGNFVVTWMSASQDGDGWGIYQRRYSSGGTALAGESLVNGTTTGDQKFPDIAMNAAGEYMIVWMTEVTDTMRVYARRYDATGTAIGTEFEVPSTSTAYQGYPRAAMRDDGVATVVWQSLDQDGSGQGIYAQRIDNAQAKLGSEFRVNSTFSTNDNQQDPDIDITADGDFVVVWSSFDDDGDHYGIHAKRYDSTATNVGSYFQVNGTTSNAQQNPSVCMSDSGKFVITWNSYAQDGSYDGVYFQAYSSSGTTNGVETLVNTRTTDFQQFPACGFDRNGEDFVVTWQDGLRSDTATHDGDDYGIYFQRGDVKDTIPPTAVCQNATLTLNGSGNQTLSASDVDNGSSDNSGSVELEVSPNAFTCTNLGSNTVTLTVSDGSGNTATCTASIEVQDLDPPSALCQAIVVYLDLTGNASITGNDIDNGSTDNCSVASRTASTTAFTCSDLGTNAVTLTVTDSSSNSATCTTTVTVEDSLAPTATCQSITLFLDGSGNGMLSGSDIDNGSTDNCTIATRTASLTAFTCSDLGSNAVTLTIADGSGNTSTCFTTVTVTDSTSPMAACQAVTVYLSGSGNASVTATTLDNGSTDNCAISTRIASVTSFTCNEIGSNAVTLTVEDGSGNSATCTTTVTVTDTASPTASCQPFMAYLDGSGNANIAGSDIDNGSVDNCSIATRTASISAFTCGDVGTNSVTLTIADGSGNTSTCATTVTVNDSTPPSAICQSVTIFLDGSGNASITASDIDNGSTDNCAIATRAASATAFTCSDVGANSVLLTLTDGTGNTSTCTALVTVTDSVSPTAACQAVTIFLDGSGNATLSGTDIDNGSTDNCTIATRSASVSAFTCSDIGSNSVTLTVADGTGNTSTCATMVTVADSTYPTATCQSISLYLDGSGNATLTGSDIDNGSVDNCSIATRTASISAFTCGDIGTNSVTLTIADGSGNTSTCTTTVTVNDSTPPSAICQAVTIFLDGSGNASITASDIDNGSTDNCAIATQAAGTTAFTCSDVGPNSVVLTLTDGSGNSSTCAATVSVSDSTSPAAACQPILVYLDGTGNASVSATDIDNGSTDNCAITTRNLSPTAFTCNDIGSNSVTLTVADASGNAATCVTTLTVADSISPTAICQSINVYLDGNGSASLGANDISASTDNCGIDSSAVDLNTFNCSDIGNQAVALTVWDASGNSASCTAAVSVLDTLAPQVTCVNDTVYLDQQGVASILASDVTGSISDNCSLGTTSVSPNAFNGSNLGTNVVTLTATDGSGNIGTCTATVTVLDTLMSGIDPAGMLANGLNLQLWPNPTQNILHLKAHCGLCWDGSIQSVKLIDMHGRVLLRSSIEFHQGEATIDLSLLDIASGTYLLNLEAEGKKVSKQVVRL